MTGKPRLVGLIRLRNASREDIVLLAQAKQWVIGPDMLKDLADPHSPERDRISLIDQLVLPGSIDMVVDPTIPKGYVIPRGVPLIVPRSYAASPATREVVRQARPMDEVTFMRMVRFVALVVCAVAVLVGAWAYVTYGLTL